VNSNNVQVNIIIVEVLNDKIYSYMIHKYLPIRYIYLTFVSCKSIPILPTYYIYIPIQNKYNIIRGCATCCAQIHCGNIIGNWYSCMIIVYV